MLNDEELKAFLAKVSEALPKGAQYWLHATRLPSAETTRIVTALVFAESDTDFYRFKHICNSGVMAAERAISAEPLLQCLEDRASKHWEALEAPRTQSPEADSDTQTEDEAFRDIGISINASLPASTKVHLFGCRPEVGILDARVRRVRAYVLVEEDADFTEFQAVYQRGVSEVARSPGFADLWISEERKRHAPHNPPLGRGDAANFPQIKRLSVRGVRGCRFRWVTLLHLRLLAARLRRDLARGRTVIITGETGSGKSIILNRLPGTLVTPDRHRERRESLLPLSLAWKASGPLRIDEPQAFEWDSVKALLRACAAGGRPVAVAAQREDFIRDVFADYAAHRDAPPIVWVTLESHSRPAQSAARQSQYRK